MSHNYFQGSYKKGDVRFLLKPIDVENTPTSIKEKLIQSGLKHYSEMLTHEGIPSPEYLNLFEQALQNNQCLMAKHTLTLARKILATRASGVTLVSLARAGTPIGVLLKKVLEQYFDVTAEHYSVSIIRDIGIDENALKHILEYHAPETLVFVDGWTGKGVIARQLESSLKKFHEAHQVEIKPELYVLADLSGSAAVSASSEDYLIPSSILNATVSGLISRSVIDNKKLSENDYHGCYFYKDYLNADVSNEFIDSIMSSVKIIIEKGAASVFDESWNENDEASDKKSLQKKSIDFLNEVKERFGISNENLVKPGIGESTRVLLRREADLLLVQDRDDPSVEHLIYLANAKKIEIQDFKNLPYRAVALIKELL